MVDGVSVSAFYSIWERTRSMNILDLLKNGRFFWHLLWRPFGAELGVLGEHLPGKRYPVSHRADLGAS
jgi:hypothetical protein